MAVQGTVGAGHAGPESERSWEHRQGPQGFSKPSSQEELRAQEASRTRPRRQALRPHRLHTLLKARGLATEKQQHPICNVKEYWGCRLERGRG